MIYWPAELTNLLECHDHWENCKVTHAEIKGQLVKKGMYKIPNGNVIAFEIPENGVFAIQNNDVR